MHSFLCTCAWHGKLDTKMRSYDARTHSPDLNALVLRTLRAVADDALPVIVLARQVPLLVGAVAADDELVAGASQPGVRRLHDVGAAQH